jgi:hypothetical protein
VGVILYECLAGRRPFDAASVADLFVQICRDDPPPIDDYVPDLPRALRDLVMGCLNRRPDRRPQDGTVLARALHRVSSRLSGVLSVPGTLSSRPPKAVGGRRTDRPAPNNQMEPTAPDLSEYGAFQVPDELRLDFGDLGALDTPASIASAVAKVAAGRTSVPGAPASARTPTPAEEPRPRASIPLDIDPRDLPTGQGRRSYAGSPATTTGSRPKPAGVPQREAVRPGRAGRLPEVPGVGVLLGAGLWVALAAASVVLFGLPALPTGFPAVGAALGFVVLAVVLTLGATSVGVLMRTRGSPGYTLGVVGLGGLGVTVAALALGLRHVMPNLPGIRDNHVVMGLFGVAALALLAVGLGLRGLFAGADAFRLRPPRAVAGVLLLVTSVGLLVGGGLAFYALGSGTLTDLGSCSSSLGAGPSDPASE